VSICFKTSVFRFFRRKPRAVKPSTGPLYDPGETNVSPEKWALIRVAMSGIASLNEIRSSWNIIDLADANEALDIKEEAEAFYANMNKPK